MNEIEKALAEAKKMRLVSQNKKGFKITSKGIKYLEKKFPFTVKRQKIRDMTIEEILESANSEEITKELAVAVKEGLLVKIMGDDGMIAWIDSRHKRNLPKGSVIIDGKFGKP